jgi:hypothetical protein
MKEYYNSVQHRMQSELARSAIGYLDVGLDLFHHEHRGSSTIIEPSIGNLAIAVELMLKTFLVKQNPLLLFRDLPLELKVLFACPDAVKGGSFNWRAYDVELRSYGYKTMELNELISVFLIFFPSQKQVLRPHLKFLSRCRNASVHLSLPSFQTYELERTVYVALRVYLILSDYDSDIFKSNWYHLDKRDEEFLSKYNTERTERVRKKIESARENAKRIKAKNVQVLVDGWEVDVTECPVCGCDGVLTGETTVEADIDEDGSANPYLVFLADTFKCDECGLSLDDANELQLAGMELSYDRPESDMEKWVAGMEPPEFEDYYYDRGT